MEDTKTAYGFVYMWCDTLKNKYYVGSHGGKQSHALRYKCGNTIMKRTIKKRPEMCKKHILEYCYTDDRQILYDMEERWLNFYDVKNNKNFYNHKNFAVGPIAQKSSRKGLKMKDIKPGWVNPNKGKKSIDILGYELIPIIPPKPFILTIKEPSKDSYEMEFKNLQYCIDNNKVSKSFLRRICILKKLKILREMKNLKHKFPKGTIIYHKYKNPEDEASPEEISERIKILKNLSRSDHRDSIKHNE
jgi:hypothetical protein